MGMNILAADIGGTNTKMGMCNERGDITQFTEYATEAHLGGPHLMERLLVQMENYRHFDAIAISTSGQVNAEEGSIVYANENIPNYTGMQIKQMIETRFRKPVKVENDVNAAALGEAAFGAAIGYADFLCLTFGTGIGGAIMINHQIYRGATGSAAEFGHMFTHAVPNGSSQPMKSYYETFASTTALVHTARQVDSQVVDGRSLFDRMGRQGRTDDSADPHGLTTGDDSDSVARAQELSDILDRWVTEVSAGLASLVHIFNPSAIIVGGGVMERDNLVQLVEQRTQSLIIPSFANVRIIKASLGNRAGLLGAASMFLR